MSRIRSVHPGLWTDEAFVCLSDAAQIFFIGLWTECDDQGAFEWKPLQLRLKLRGAKDGGVEGLLAELETVGSIRQYELGGKKFGVVKNFGKYQRPKKPKITFEVPESLMDFAGFKPSADDVRKIKCDEQDGRCFYCESEITHYSKKSNSLEIDHKLPRSRNGSDDLDNLVAACRACNRSKGDMTAEEYMAKRNSRSAVACENGTFASSRIANNSDKNPKPEKSSQMEDGGGRMEEEGLGGMVAREPLAHLESQLREAAGWQSEPAPMLAVTGEVQALIDAGADLEADVLPVVRAIAPKATSRTSWRFFLAAIARQRDQRIAASKIVSPPTTSNGKPHAASSLKPSRNDTFAAIRARIDRAKSGPGGDGDEHPRDPAEDAA